MEKFQQRLKRDYLIISENLDFYSACKGSLDPIFKLQNIFKKYPQVFISDTSFDSIDELKNKLKKEEIYPLELIIDMLTFHVDKVCMADQYLNQILIKYESDLRIVSLPRDQIHIVKILEVVYVDT